MSKKSTSNSKKAYLGAYPNIYEANRRRRLERHLKKHPEDKIAKKAIDNIKYRRKVPYSRIWNCRLDQEHAHLLRILGENGNKVLTNKKIKAPSVIPSKKEMDAKYSPKSKVKDADEVTKAKVIRKKPKKSEF